MKKKIKKVITQTIILITILTYNPFSYALIYSIPEKKNRLIGKNLKITIPQGNTFPLEHFAEKFQVGISNLLEANPNIDVYLPQPSKKIIIPHQLILPDTPHKGIIINSAEMRLYYYPNNSNKVIVFPIGIGEFGHNTPFNWITSIKSKKRNPTWTPSKNIHDEYITQGIILPKIIPPGPNNPMGQYALYIGNLLAIHGTNTNFGIGLRVSHGCIRLRTNDIKYLFEHVPVGTRVQFINEPIKSTIESNNKFFLEIHQPLSITQEEFNSIQPITIQLSNSITKILKNKKIDHDLAIKTLKERLGIPINITLN